MAGRPLDPRERLVAALGSVAGGDRAALRLVYELTAAKLFGVCLRISQDREAAEDILQDVYLKVWNRAGRFDAARASPITWLCAIARNAAIDWRRANVGRVMLPAEDAPDLADESSDALTGMEAAETRAQIFRCIDQLQEAPRAAIRAAFFDGLSYPELAERMAVPLGTMKSWIHRGLKQLKGCLGDG